MANKSAGFQWLKEHFNLHRYTLTHCSYIGNNESIELTSKGNVEQIYGRKYALIDDTPLLHIEFALKYDDLNLDFLKTVFESILVIEIATYIESSPTSKYARKIGFLYEFLTGKQLTLEKPISGNYTDLLDAGKYITGHTVKNNRWRINDNLLGTQNYCPIVRRTKQMEELLSLNIPEKIERLRKEFSPEIFRRAANYLYSKETRSSFEIEKEKPSADRMEKFITLLSKAGTEKTDQILDENRLVQLQNVIVDPRFAATSFRDYQNFIGQTLPNYQDFIHYICPPPVYVHSLMQGLKECSSKTEGINSEVRAAVIAFGFVFIHPFEDGNGRIHRFLIHDVLVYDGVVPDGLIIPVSAHMLNNIKDYDNNLEKYSKPLMQRVKYTKKDSGELEVVNLPEVEGYFRFPDLTDQCIYLAQTIHATLEEDIPDELLFIQRYDETKRAFQNVVDMPDKDINMMIVFLHQNKGVLPKKRRQNFSKLTDEEVKKMQEVYNQIFQLN